MDDWWVVKYTWTGGSLNTQDWWVFKCTSTGSRRFFFFGGVGDELTEIVERVRECWSECSEFC